MTTVEPTSPDTRDMVSVHDAFRRAFTDAPGQIAAVSDGDRERSARLALYLTEALWLLEVHHEGEDELLYPLLSERAPEHQVIFDKMDAQHLAAKAAIGAVSDAATVFAASGSTTDGKTLADSCASLLATLVDHLDDEETAVLPLVAGRVTVEEWAALPGHALSRYSGDRVWLPFGLVLESMPADLRERLLGALPPPVLGMWVGGGADAFANEMSEIRGTSAR